MLHIHMGTQMKVCLCVCYSSLEAQLNILGTIATMIETFPEGKGWNTILYNINYQAAFLVYLIVPYRDINSIKHGYL